MHRPTPARALAFWCVCVALGLAASCGTDAKGIEDCRDIEEARCEAAAACGDIKDAGACKRFYRDQCLHGLSVPITGGTKACVQAIKDAGACAKSGGDPATCGTLRTTARACGAVQTPETLAACSFLAPDSPPWSEGGAGGETSGSGGVTASGGTGGVPAGEGGTAGATAGAGSGATAGAGGLDGSG